MVIQHNLMSMNSNRQLGVTTGLMAKSSEKLSSGYRINRAADDAAGLSISEKMRRQIRGLSQGSDNVQDGVSYVQVADAALAEIDEMLHRMTELCVKAATESLTKKDRIYIDQEIQQLKEECNKTFKTTTFNEKLIWDENTVNKKAVGSEWRPKWTYDIGGISSLKVNDTNQGAFPDSDGFTFKVEGDKVKVAWTGYNGKKYESTEFTIPDEETLKESGLSMALNSKTVVPALYPSAAGIEPSFRMVLDSEITRAEFIEGLKTAKIEASQTYQLTPEITTSASLEEVTMSISGNVNYQTGLVSGKSRDSVDDGFMGPDNNPDTGSNRVNMDRFNFEFTKAGMTVPEGGKFKAHAEYAGLNGSVTVTATTFDPAYKGLWWDYDDEGRQYTKSYNVGTSDLASSLTAALGEDSEHSLVSNSPVGGTMTIKYNIVSDEPVKYSYSDGTTGSALSNIGEMSITLKITDKATKANVEDAIKAIKTLDFSSSGNSTISLSYNTYGYSAPVWGGTMALNIQSGADNTENDRIPIIYDVLNNHSLKINDLSTETVYQAQEGIEKVKAAQKTVDEQRALFGSYQNRMEHAFKNIDNTVENTTASESRIRDTDMAREMVKHSNESILAQAGQSILAQANQTSQGVMALLQ